MAPRTKGTIKKTTVDQPAEGSTDVAEHLEAAGPEVRRSLSEPEQHALLQLPVHDSEAIKSYVKPHEGFERVAPLTIKRLGNYPDIASALRLNIPALESALTHASALSDQEDIAHRLYRRAMENRLSIESETYRALLRLNRFLQDSEDEELQRDFAELAEWVASRTEAGRRRDPEGTDGPATPAAP